MAIQNPTLRAGTEGVKEFLQIGKATIAGSEHWVGIRPVMECGYIPNAQGSFYLNVAIRIRYDSDGVGHDKNSMNTILSNHIPSGNQAFKVKDLYASYVLILGQGAKIDDQAHKVVSDAKKALREYVSQAYDHAKSIGTQMEHTKEDVQLYLMSKLDEICSKRAIDIGDLATDVAPTDQPFVKQFQNKANQQPTATPKPTDAKGKADAKQPTTPTAKDDPYAKKEDEDLSNMSFDDLMKNISKDKGDS